MHLNGHFNYTALKSPWTSQDSSKSLAEIHLGSWTILPY